jgi:hypothetical protein
MVQFNPIVLEGGENESQEGTQLGLFRWKMNIHGDQEREMEESPK